MQTLNKRTASQINPDSNPKPNQQYAYVNFNQTKYQSKLTLTRIHSPTYNPLMQTLTKRTTSQINPDSNPKPNLQYAIATLTWRTSE